MNTSLRNRDGLLLHGFVDSDLVLDVHLIEFIDAADAVVGEHQSASLNTELARLWVLLHTGCQTGSI